MEKQRIASFDFAKGLLMFLVVYGHVIQELMHEGSLFDQGTVFAIYSFHMPLFIFVSGCFAWNRCHGSFKACVEKNFRRMIIPGLLCAIAWYFHMHYDEPIIHGYYNSMRNVWFVFGLFAIFLVCNLAYKTKHPLTWLTVFVILYYVTYDYQPIDLLKHFKIAVFLPYFVVGLYFKRLLTPPLI